MIITVSAVFAAGESGLCKIQLKSLSKTSGAPGDTFEMYGIWEETQGLKKPCINKGGENKLEILAWSNSVIKARIPEQLPAGSYRVGVYCNNPPHWQGSRWMDFEVTGKRGVKAELAKVQPPLNNTKSGQTTLPPKSDIKPEAPEAGLTRSEKSPLVSMIETNKKIIGAGAVILIITCLIIIARKKSWVKFGPWISMQEKSEIEKRSKTTPLLLMLLLLLTGMAYLFFFHRNVLIHYVSRSWESKIGPAVLFGSFLVLFGLVIYFYFVTPAKRFRTAIREFAKIGFSEVAEDSSQWHIVKDFMSSSFAEDAKFGGSYDLSLGDVYKRDGYNEFMLLFNNIVTYKVPFLTSENDSPINWLNSFMVVTIEPNNFASSVFIRRRLNGQTILPGQYAGRGRNTEELKNIGIEVSEIKEHLTDEFKKIFYAYQLNTAGDERVPSLPLELQSAFCRFAGMKENLKFLEADLSAFGGYVKLSRNGIIIHVSHRNRPKYAEELRRIMDFSREILSSAGKARF